MLCVAIFHQKGEINGGQWNFLLRGPVGTKTDLPKKPDYPMITDAMWQAVYYLSTNYESFVDLPGDTTKIIHISIGDFSLVSIKKKFCYLGHGYMISVKQIIIKGLLSLVISYLNVNSIHGIYLKTIQGVFERVSK